MPSDAQYGEISPDLPFYTVAMMNSASTLSENHPNGIADKDRDTKCHNTSSLDVPTSSTSHG
jgi:hypothetical protein